MKLAIDPVACDGRGFCAGLLPELIAEDPWGYPLPRHDSPGSRRDVDVPAELEGPARRAVHLCPRLALHLEETA